MAENRVKISVVVPMYNETVFICACLDALVAQRNARLGDDYEILVVDDGSTDDGAHKAKNYPVRFISLGKNTGKIMARKVGAEQAAFDYLLFVDARAVVSENILESCWRINYSPLLSGRQFDLEKPTMEATERLFYLIRRRYYYPFFPLSEQRTTLFIDKANFTRAPKGTTCLFIRKDLFLESVPRQFDKYTNDDTALLEYIVYTKDIKILRHYGVAITYAHRIKPFELSRWVVRRGVTFFDFYIRRSIVRTFVVVASPWCIVFFIALYCLAHPQDSIAVFAFLLLFYFMTTLLIIEKARDIPLVFLRFFKYLFWFYCGILKGWCIRIRLPVEP